MKLTGFGRGGARHPRQFGIHAEIILESDGCQRLVFRLNIDAFFGFDCLVQAIGPATPVHHAPCKFVDDDDLAILDDVINVAFEHHIGFKCLIKMVDD